MAFTVNMHLLKIIHLSVGIIYYGHAPCKYKASIWNDSLEFTLTVKVRTRVDSSLVRVK